MSTQTNDQKPATHNVLRLGWVSLLNDIGSETISRLVPFYVSGVLGASMAVVGTIEGIAEATSTLLKPVFGSLSDRTSARFSKKKFVIAGYFLSSITRPLLALAGNPFSVGLLRASDRLGKAVRTAPRDALIANSEMGAKGAFKQGKKFGINRAMDTAGAILGVAFFAVFLKYHSLELTSYEWSVLCIASIIPAVIALMIIAFGITEPKIAVKAGATPAGKAPISPTLKRYLIAVGVFGLANSSDAFILASWAIPSWKLWA
jgi:MFS family permease